MTTEPHYIGCAEIWGGNSLVDTDVCTNGLYASIVSSASGDEAGGDIYYFSVCSSDLLSRIALADLRGHGEQASRLSASLYHSLRRRMNTLDGAAVLTDLNTDVQQHGFTAMTTAAVLSYYRKTSKLFFSYAGHPPALLRRNGERWRPLEVRNETYGANLPLGVRAGMRYDQDEIALNTGDRLFLFTDGVVECPDPEGEDFGDQRLLDALEEAGDTDLPQTKARVLRALRAHAGGELTHDDCTFLVIEIR